MAGLGAHLWNRLTRDPARLVAIHVAADGGETRVTAGALVRDACAARAALEALDLKPGSLIGIVHGSGPMLHAAWLGALWAGHVPTMVAPPSPRMEPRKYAEGFVSIVGHLGIEALAIDAPTRGKLGDMLPPLPLIDTGTLPNGPPMIPPVPRDTSAEAVVQHTSGTTGLQKAIGFTADQIFAHTSVYRDLYAIGPNDIIASWLPLYHDMGFIACFVTPLVLGIPVVEISPFDWVARPAMLLEVIALHRATLCWLPNFAFRVLSQPRLVAGLDSALDLSSIKAFVSCSEPVQADSIGGFVAALGSHGVGRDQVIASYAMAENLFLVSQNPLGNPRTTSFDRRALEDHRAIPDPDGVALVSNGPPVSSTQIAIRRDGEGVTDGQIGEIWIAGTHLFGGYRKTDVTGISANRWYNTGDLGFLYDGEIYITGRAKDLIIIRGRNYYPHDIETLVGEIDGVAPGRVAAFGIADQVSGTEKLILMLELAEGRDADTSQILLAIRQAVAQNFDTTVGDIRVLPPRGLVKSTAGKVARPENRRRYLDMIAGS